MGNEPGVIQRQHVTARSRARHTRHCHAPPPAHVPFWRLRTCKQRQVCEHVDESDAYQSGEDCALRSSDKYPSDKCDVLPSQFTLSDMSDVHKEGHRTTGPSAIGVA